MIRAGKGFARPYHEVSLQFRNQTVTSVIVVSSGFGSPLAL